MLFNFIEDDVERIEFINNIGNLIRDGEIPPETLNECLANSFSINRYLITLAESVLKEDDDLKDLVLKVGLYVINVYKT